jgi:multiple RNA-binding domain-containing protein 1
MKKRNVTAAAPEEQDASQLFTTRLCIKNLPLKLTGPGLREYLSKTSKTPILINDCKVLEGKRMAFVGVATSEQAVALVKDFNRAYCQTCRLSVEFARKNAKASKENQQEQVSETKKPKDNSKRDDRRKQEFLAVMGAGPASSTTSGNKFWANDDVENATHTKEARLPIENNNSGSSENDTSESEIDSDDDANPLAPLAAPAAKTVKKRNDDFDFIKSKTIQTEDLEAQEENSVANRQKNSGDSTDLDSDSSSSRSESDEETMLKPFQNDNVKAKETSNNIVSSSSQIETEISAEISSIATSSRLFLRNLPFITTPEDLQQLFHAYIVEDVHLPVDDLKNFKGFGFVTFQTPKMAQEAFNEYDGTDFHGRLLHIMPAKSAPVTDETDGNLTLKQKQEKEKQKTAGKDQTGWSASFVRSDAVVDTLASRLGLRKGDILAVKDGMSSGDAAVRLALGETAVIEENRKYFSEHGINMEALVSLRSKDEANDLTDQKIQRSKTSILVKNLPADTTVEELMKTFGTMAETPSEILLPPSRTIAVVKYSHENDAKMAMRRLAYRRFKSIPLYLEYAPMDAHIKNKDVVANDTPIEEKDKDDDDDLEDVSHGPTLTVYVKNLNFATSEDKLRDFFAQHITDVRTIRIPQKVVPIKKQRNGELNPADGSKQLSMGYGFVELGSTESARKAIKALNGKVLDGHTLEVTASKAGVTTKPSEATSKSSKLMVRNVPFQATRKELLQLFGSFGQLKKVRLPKKFDGGHRGFCFIEYLTPKEAAAAMKSLSRTHLYGRHLVLEWAASDAEADDIDKLRTKAQRDVDEKPPPNKKIRFD